MPASAGELVSSVGQRHTGPGNAVWRLGEHLVLRLPRTSDAADRVVTELEVLGLVYSRGLAAVLGPA
jgi:hypothetical protein